MDLELGGAARRGGGGAARRGGGGEVGIEFC